MLRFEWKAMAGIITNNNLQCVTFKRMALVVIAKRILFQFERNEKLNKKSKCEKCKFCKAE